MNAYLHGRGISELDRDLKSNLLCQTSDGAIKVVAMARGHNVPSLIAAEFF